MEEKRIGFDIDDVFSIIPFYYLRTKLNLDYLLSQCSLTGGRIRKFLYRRFRKSNDEIGWLINRLRLKGHQIVLISAVPEKFREEVSTWLLKHRIPYNRLYLWSQDWGSREEFKLRVIRRERLEYYIDDRLKIIHFLKENSLNCCQIIHYQGQTPLVLEKMFGLD